MVQEPYDQKPLQPDGRVLLRLPGRTGQRQTQRVLELRADICQSSTNQLCVLLFTQANACFYNTSSILVQNLSCSFLRSIFMFKFIILLKHSLASGLVMFFF